MNPLVSIVIPVYNREKYISEAIESAINQTYKNIEIVVVDNCSTDHTWDILKNYAEKDKRIRIFRNDRNIGPVLNWQECFHKAKGEYIKILWSDDWMSLDFIEKAISLFDKDTAFVFSWHQIREQDKIICSYSYKNIEYEVKDYLNNILYINTEEFPVSPGCALFRKKDVLDSFVSNIPNTNNLDSKLNGAGNDLLLFLNTSIRYKKIKIIPEYISFFRHHSESFSVKNNLDLFYIWSIIFFLENNCVDKYYTNIFKFKLYIKQLRNKKYGNAYKYLNRNPYYGFHIIYFLIYKYIF